MCTVRLKDAGYEESLVNEQWSYAINFSFNCDSSNVVYMFNFIACGFMGYFRISGKTR